VNDSRWRGWLVAAAIFVLGVGAGCAGMTWAGIRVFRHTFQNPSSSRGFAERATERIEADLEAKLQLTPEESSQVRAILAQSTANLKAIRMQTVAQTSAELRTFIERISAVLPQEKRAEFQRLMAQHYKRLGLGSPESETPSPTP
jgi:hypothetical protein